MDEKNAFLADIRDSLGFSDTETRGPEHCPDIFAETDDSLTLDRIHYRTHVEKQALLQILVENAEPLRLGVHPVVSLNAAGDKIVELIQATSPEFSSTKQVILHDNHELVELQLWKRLAGSAVQVHTSYPADPEIREKTIESYIGITVPKWIVAESATLVQLTERGQPRSTSLLPSIHIAVIQLRHIIASLTELYALLQRDQPKGAVTLITGPSKTADIEAHMVHGAHGPKEVHLVVIDEQLDHQANFKGSGLFSS